MQAEEIHDTEYNDMLNTSWLSIRYNLQKSNLDFLRIDLSNAYCPAGCHRLALEAVEKYVRGSPPKILEFVGVRDLTEKKQILRLMKGCGNWKKTIIAFK